MLYKNSLYYTEHALSEHPELEHALLNNEADPEGIGQMCRVQMYI